jgi:hypothetical protein
MRLGTRGVLAVATLVATLSQSALPERAAAEADGGFPGAWLTNYSGARALGMGGAFVATADDALGILWNPAGLPGMEQNQIMFENARLFEDTSVNGVSFAVPGSWFPSLGVSMVSLRSGDFQRTNEINGDLGTFREGETAYLFTLARSVSRRASLGANVKVVQQTVEEFSAGGFGADVGAMLQVLPTLKVGVSVLNLGGPSITLRSTAETFPVQARAGFSLGVLGGRGQIAAEIDRTGDAALRFHGGTEYWIQPVMALRVGVDGDRATGGFAYQLGPRYQLDYGVADHPLGLTHRIGLSMRFGGFFASSDAEPAVFSPTGEKATTQVRLNAHTKTEADSWTLEFVDKARRVARRFGGPGLPPPHVQWDGKDEAGMPVADGLYTYRLVVRDKDGRILTSSTRRVEVSTGGPQGDVPVTTNP